MCVSMICDVVYVRVICNGICVCVLCTDVCDVCMHVVYVCEVKYVMLCMQVSMYVMYVFRAML